jgi:hypothetical protein
MSGPVADYIGKHRSSPEFGSVWTANAVLPDGRLGMSERRSHFEFRQTTAGQFEAVLAKRSYHHDGGHIVGIRDLEGPAHRHAFGPFPTLADAKTYASGYIRDYTRTAAEERAHAVKYQQNEDYHAVHGRRPRTAKKSREHTAEMEF